MKYLFIIFSKFFIKLNRSCCRKLEVRFPNFFGNSEDYSEDLKKLINSCIKDKSFKKILEVGGTNRPILKKSHDYIYFGLDIDPNPLCFDVYDFFLVQSIENKLEKKFDLIISKTLLEHLTDNNKCLSVIYDALHKKGMTIHYIPSKYHFYSIILRIIGPKLQKILIHYFRPEAELVTGYPAYFHKCSPSQIKELCKKIGFNDILIIPYYRATDYFSFFIPAFVLVALFENLFKYFGLKMFASGMILFAKK